MQRMRNVLWQEFCTFSWKQYLMTTGILILVGVIGLAIRTKHDGKKITFDAVLHCSGMAAYVCFVYQITIANREIGSREGMFLQFESFLDFKGDVFRATYDLFNVLLFVPYGYLLGWWFKEAPGLKYLGKVLGYSMMGSIVIETLQLLLKCGYFEVVDIVSNTIGGVAGASLFYLFFKLKQGKREDKKLFQ